MRKIINGKLYDTETAREVASFESNFARNDFSFYEETLFRKRNGEFFLSGKGGPMSHYAKREIGGMTGGEAIIPLTEEEARRWLEDNADVDTYLKYFVAEE